MDQNPALERLRRLLLSSRWLEGVRTLSMTQLLSSVYDDWTQAQGLPKKGLKSLERFGQEYGAAAPLTEAVLHYLWQVRNGGHRQWFDNGFATDPWNGVDVVNAAVRDWMVDGVRASPLRTRPGLAAAMAICASAHPTMRAGELAALDDKLMEVAESAEAELNRWLTRQLALKVKPVKDPDERFERGSAFLEQLFDRPEAKAPRMLSMADLARMNQVSRAFKKLFHLPTLKQVAAECGLKPAEIEKFYTAEKVLRGEQMVSGEDLPIR